MTAPAAPAQVTAKGDRGVATVTWEAVDADPAVTSYTVTAYAYGISPTVPAQPPPTVTVIAPATSVTLALDTTAWAFTVSAVNADGVSPETPLSSQVELGRGVCATCFYWDNSASLDGSGLCRQAVPTTADRGRRQSASAVWPVTQSTDWCGQYEASP